MGKRLVSQRRGRGGPTFRAAKNAVAEARYVNYSEEQKQNVLRGTVAELVHDTMKSSVLAKVKFENNEFAYSIAAEGLEEGQTVEYGRKAEVKIGNVIPLKDIVEGCPVFNVEKIVGDGGSLVRASGSYAIIVTKDKGNVSIKLPSGKTLALNEACRASIGCAAGGGRTDKPMVKAGTKFHAMKARNKFWPNVRGVAKNAIDHPFGGMQHHPGKSKSTSRHAAPGRKVGAIASSRTGRKKK